MKSKKGVLTVCSSASFIFLVLLGLVVISPFVAGAIFTALTVFVFLLEKRFPGSIESSLDRIELLPNSLHWAMILLFVGTLAVFLGVLFRCIREDCRLVERFK